MVGCMSGPAAVASSRPTGAVLVVLAAGALATGCEPVAGSDADGKVATDGPVGDGPPDARVRVADSERDFAGTQGAGGWQYLYQEMPSEVRRELVHRDGAWVVDDERFWTQLTVTGGHPNVGGRVADGPVAIHLPVRRWLADAEGAATIAYRASREHPGPCGDGVVTRVIVDDVLRWEQPLPGDGTGPTVVEDELMVMLGTGSTVELVIDPVAGDGCDSTAFKAVITVSAPD
jgi:hypothetical protein